MKTRIFFVIVMVMVAAFLTACGPAPTPEVVTVVETVVVEKEVEGETVTVVETVVVEKEVETVVEVEKEVEVVVTATPEPLPTAVAAEEPVYGGTLRFSSLSDIPSLDPAERWNSASWAAAMMVFNGLLRFESRGTAIVPDLAEELPTVSDDGLTYTFTLREGVTFQNGREVTAEDVAYSLNRMLRPETNSTGVGLYLGIKGATAVNGGDVEEAEGIEILDDQSIQITLEQPNSAFMSLMALPFTYIVPQEEVERLGEDWRTNPIGSGPFRLEEHTPGQKAVFVKNPDYFREDEPYLDQVIWEMGVEPEVALLRIEKGEQDLMEEEIPAAEYNRVVNDPALQPYVLEQPLNDTYYMTMSLLHPALAEPEVRQAIFHAIDREKLLRTLQGRGIPAEKGIFPPGSDFYNTEIELPEYDPEKARELLAEAGYPDGFDINLWDYNVTPYKEMGLAIQQDLEQIGINVDLHLMIRSAWLAKVVEPENELTFNQWPLDIPHGSYIVDSAFTTAAQAGCCNFSQYSDPEVDEWASRAVSTTDPQEMIELYQQIDHKVIEEEMLWVPLYHPTLSYLHSPTLGGFYIHPNWGFTKLFYEYWKVNGE